MRTKYEGNTAKYGGNTIKHGGIDSIKLNSTLSLTGSYTDCVYKNTSPCVYINTSSAIYFIM